MAQVLLYILHTAGCIKIRESSGLVRQRATLIERLAIAVKIMYCWKSNGSQGKSVEISKIPIARFQTLCSSGPDPPKPVSQGLRPFAF